MVSACVIATCMQHVPSRTVRPPPAPALPSHARGLHRRRHVCSASQSGGPDEADAKKRSEMAGAGLTLASPGWLTALQRNWGGKAGIPVADAKPDDIKDLLGGALFQALYKWMRESGPIYLLPTGPFTSFVVISDPAAAKHVLRNYGMYGKGLVAEVAEFLFGTGFAIAEGELWKSRRRAVAPALHRAYLAKMVDLVFGACALRLAEQLGVMAASQRGVDIEAKFSQLTLDIIGKSVFNYDFDALTTDSPVIQAVYTALKETEARATDLLPFWKIPLFRLIDPRQQRAAEAVRVIREVTESLVAKCKAMVDAEEKAAAGAAFGEEYMNEADPSVLRFLLASRVEVTSTQLRDDLLSMLVAGHETTASVLTWTIYLLAKRPDALKRAQEEVDAVLGDRAAPSFGDIQALPYLMTCINESMRLYPHPPVLLRRALEADTLPGGISMPVGQDILISIYNIHRSPAVWEHPDEFRPERFELSKGFTFQQVPSEVTSDYKFIPFSGGPRKCIGDQFALLEAIVSLAVLLKRFDFALVPGQTINMTTGATIHTTNGLFVNVKERGNLAKTAQLAQVGAKASG